MSSRSKANLPRPARELIEGFGVETIARLLEGLSASNIPMAVFDPEDRLVYACPNFASIYALGGGPQTFASVMRHCHATHQGPLIETDDIDGWLEAAHAKRRATPHRRFEIDLVDGRWFQALETTYDNGWMLLVLIDLTAFKAKEVDLTSARDAAIREARTDELTGLASRRAIMRYLDLTARSATPDAPLTIALIDLDHFKQINDTLGHDTGDTVLCHLGKLLSGAFRNSDRAGRVGGEEFLLVMPGTDMSAALLAIQRFRRHWLRMSRVMPVGKGSTFSVGIAQWTPGQSPRELYRTADEALYRAKSAGRDRMVCAGVSLPVHHEPEPADALPATGTND